MTFVLLLWMAWADISGLKAEPDLGRRSDLALANGDKSIDEARKAYGDGDDTAARAAIEEVAASVELSYDALAHLPGQPRNNKYYKRAELKVTALIRRLNGFRLEVSFDSQQSIDSAIKRLSDVHDDILNAIMSKKKKQQ